MTAFSVVGTIRRGRRRPFRSIVLLLFLVSSAFRLWADDGTTKLYLFEQESCPSCEKMKPFLAALDERYPELEVVAFEVGSDLANLRRLQQTAAKFGIRTVNVPAVFLGTHSWVGYSDAITAGIERAVRECIETGCIDALADPLPDVADDPAAAEHVGTDGAVVDSKLFGRVELESLPIVLATVLIALLDGVNPCSLWVLTFLLALVLHTGSRRKVVLVGVVFLVTTAAVYGLFILGIVRIVALLSAVRWIRYAVAFLAFAMGAINVKDYFAFKRGVSLTISDKNRRSIGARARRLVSSDRSAFSLAASTMFLAGGVAVVELPCTAGFPVIWSNLLSDAAPTASIFGLLLALYLFIYLVDELLIVGAAAVSFRRITMNETKGRFLKLLGGTVMIALAAVMIVKPQLMESLGAVAIVFALALLVVALVVFVERRTTRRGRRSSPAPAGKR